MEREVLKQVIIDQQEYKSPKIFFNRTLTDTIMGFVDDPRPNFVQSPVKMFEAKEQD